MSAHVDGVIACEGVRENDESANRRMAPRLSPLKLLAYRDVDEQMHNAGIPRMSHTLTNAQMRAFEPVRYVIGFPHCREPLMDILATQRS